jgi:RNA-binding protein YhbY
MIRDVPKSIANLAKSQSIDVSVRIGKDGVTEALISELNIQLKKRGLVKVKANKSASSDRDHRNSIFSIIADRSKSTIVFQRGNVAVFWKKGHE